MILPDSNLKKLVGSIYKYSGSNHWFVQIGSTIIMKYVVVDLFSWRA